MLKATELKIAEAAREREQILDYLHECENALEVFENIKEPVNNPHKHFLKIKLRADSRAYKVRQLILDAQQPLTLNAIYGALFGHLGAVKQSRLDSLRGNLNGMCEKLRVFVRTAPNTYGLMELGHK